MWHKVVVNHYPGGYVDAWQRGMAWSFGYFRVDMYDSLIAIKQTTYIRERTNDDTIHIAINAKNRKKTHFRHPLIHSAS